MNIKPRVSKSQSVKTMERLTGGPLTMARVLKAIRETDELSQIDFAKLLGISRQNLCDLEKSRKMVSPSRAAVFAQKLGYPPAYFIQLALQEELDRAGVKLTVTSIEAA